MQLQRSLFSFYKVFTRKTPACIWIGLALLLIGIIGLQMISFKSQEPVNAYEQCLLQYFNSTRSDKPQQKSVAQQSKNKTFDKQKQSSQDIKIENGAEKKSKYQLHETPYNLKAQYYQYINQTTTLSIFLSDKIPYEAGKPSCQIILNIQKLRHKQEKQNLQTQTLNPSLPEGKTLNMLQKIQTQQQQQNQGRKDNEQNQQHKQKAQQQDKNKDDRVRPQNVRNFNELSLQQNAFLLNEHPFLHLTGNGHIVYLAQDNQFQQKHGIQTHAIILSKQQVKAYPQTLLGISSKLWRFHGNQQISLIETVFESLVSTFKKVSISIKQIHRASIYNFDLSLKEQIQALQKKQQQAQNNKQNKEEPQPTSPKNGTENSNASAPSNSSEESIQEKIKQLLLQTVLYFQIQPLYMAKIYFHYPQILRYEQLLKLTYLMELDWSIFSNIFFLIVISIQLIVASVMVGLLVRYLFFWIVTIYLFMGGCFANEEWGWVSKYLNLVRNRLNTQNKMSSCKMLLHFTLALIGMLTIFTFGSRYVVENLYIYALPFSQTYYAEMFLRNMLIVELFYYVCCRSRVTLRYFTYFSFMISMIALYFGYKYYYYNITWFMNLHMWIHLALMCIFSAFQNIIGRANFYNEFTPSLQKPRALYYVGYDLSWQSTLPPVWTYFTSYFDLKYFNEKQKCLIERDYQLLYGRLLGMNQRQELPEDQEVESQEQVHKLNQNLSEINEMGLLH